MKQSQIFTPLKNSDSAWLDIRGVRYHVRQWGDSSMPLLVMLHGWGDTGGAFQFTVDELKHDWFVVAPDWRGFGLSYLRTDSYWFPDYVNDLQQLLEHYQPDAPVNLLGHSMGANIAGLYAGIFPERVRAFVNVEGFGLADSEPSKAPQTYRRWIEESARPPRYASYGSFDELALRIQVRSPSLSRERALFIARQWAEQSADGRVVLRADPAHKLPNATQYRRAEAEACWDQVTAPVLLVMGADTDFKAGMKSWLDDDQSRHPFHGAETEIIEAAGHMVHFEAPAALASVTEAFLKTAV